MSVHCTLYNVEYIISIQTFAHCVWKNTNERKQILHEVNPSAIICLRVVNFPYIEWAKVCMFLFYRKSPHGFPRYLFYTDLCLTMKARYKQIMQWKQNVFEAIQWQRKPKFCTIYGRV